MGRGATAGVSGVTCDISACKADCCGLSAVKRDIGKGHVLDAVRAIVREEISKHHSPA